MIIKPSTETVCRGVGGPAWGALLLLTEASIVGEKCGTNIQPARAWGASSSDYQRLSLPVGGGAERGRWRSAASEE